ncbi:tetratricopeptide repeat protein [Streptomyces sp. PRKS01-65]|nr:tetratricopeptide repeat protein [Streptomyces harenosi]
MSLQAQARRRRIVLASAAGVVAAGGMSGDLIFGVLEGGWAVGGFAGAAAAVAGLSAFMYRHSADDLAVTARAAGLELRRQLPPVNDLVGRETLLAALLDQLGDVPDPRGAVPQRGGAAAQPSVVVVHGAAGTGKTNLALNAAHRVAEHYPDGQLYVDLKGDEGAPRDSADVLARFLRDLGVDAADIPRSPGDRAVRFRSLTNPMRLLVVLDNAHSTAQIEPLLPGGVGCSVLVTSRRALAEGNITPRRKLEVELPDEDEALKVLGHYAGQDRLDEDPAAALDILRFCGRLPLALRIIGGKLASRPDLTLRRMCARLADERERLRELVFGSESLDACLSLTFRDLPADARHAIGLVSCLPVGRLTDWHLERCLPAAGAVGRVTDELLAVGLMETDGPRTPRSGYRLHDLVRVFSRERHEARPPQDRQDGEERLVRAYRDAVVYLASGRAPELGAEASRERAGDLDRAAAGDWVAAEAERIRWAITRARRLGMEAEGAEIAEGLSYFLDDVRLSFESAGWLFDPGTERRPRVVRSLRRGRARAALDDGRPQEALDILGQAPLPGEADPAPTARDRALIARAHAARSDYRTALGEMTRAVRELRADHDDWHVLSSLEKLGEFQRWRGQPERAEESQREALRLAERSGDRRAQARLARTLAETLGYLRRPQEAAPLLERAIRDFGVLDDRIWEGASHYALGKVYRLLGRREEALDAYDKAEDIFGPMGETLWRGRVDNARIRVYAGQGRFDDAWASARRSLELCRQAGSEIWYCHTQRDVGWLHLRQGRPQEALAPLTEAVDATRRAGDAYAEAMALHLRGVAHRELGRTDEARADLEAALATYRGGQPARGTAGSQYDDPNHGAVAEEMRARACPTSLVGLGQRPDRGGDRGGVRAGRAGGPGAAPGRRPGGPAGAHGVRASGAEGVPDARRAGRVRHRAAHRVLPRRRPGVAGRRQRRHPAQLHRVAGDGRPRPGQLSGGVPPGRHDRLRRRADRAHRVLRPEGRRQRRLLQRRGRLLPAPAPLGREDRRHPRAQEGRDGAVGVRHEGHRGHGRRVAPSRSCPVGRWLTSSTTPLSRNTRVAASSPFQVSDCHIANHSPPIAMNPAPNSSISMSSPYVLNRRARGWSCRNHSQVPYSSTSAATLSQTMIRT